MKRQRNTQQVKEHEKCPPNQTKEEETGNLTTNFNIILQFSLSAGNQFGVNGFFDQQIFISSKAVVKQIAGG